MTQAGDAARFAADLIRIDTTNRGGGDAQERPAAEYVAARLAEAGLEPVLLESAPGRANVVARIGGAGAAGERGLLLHGHLDVVPADPAAWSVHPFSGEIRDGVLWGRGAVDMKNADAVLIALVASGRAAAAGRGATSCSRSPRTRRTPRSSARAGWSSGTRAVRGLHRGHRGVGGVHLSRRAGAAALPDRVGRARHRLAEADRPGPGRARLQAEQENAVTRLAEAVARIGAYRWPVRLIPTVRAAIEAIAAAAGTRLPDGVLDGSCRRRSCSAGSGPRERWWPGPCATAPTRPCWRRATRST